MTAVILALALPGPALGTSAILRRPIVVVCPAVPSSVPLSLRRASEAPAAVSVGTVAGPSFADSNTDIPFVTPSPSGTVFGLTLSAAHGTTVVSYCDV